MDYKLSFFDSNFSVLIILAVLSIIVILLIVFIVQYIRRHTGRR